MNKKEHLLACVAEEAGEIARAAGKCLRFGVFDTEPGKSMYNLDAVLSELCELEAVVEMLLAEHQYAIFTPDAWARIKAHKKERVLKYMERARLTGALAD